MRTSSLLKKHQSLAQRDPSAPRERNRNRSPYDGEQHTMALRRSGCIRRDGGCGVRWAPWRGDALVRDLLLRHVMLLIHRTHQQIAQQSEQQHAGEDIHRDVVRLMCGHSMCELEFTDVVD